jgi:hypothetical protein
MAKIEAGEEQDLALSTFLNGVSQPFSPIPHAVTTANMACITSKGYAELSQRIEIPPA